MKKIISTKINKRELIDLYLDRKLSVSSIAVKYNCSQNKINYWLKKFGIEKRTIADAVYLKNNPKGDPFRFQFNDEKYFWFLYGLGLGLYWGEGNKINKNSVRLGNSDPNLLVYFLKFLTDIYNIDKKKLRFGLQIFSDINIYKAKNYWSRKLNIDTKQFLKVTVSRSVSEGTYKKKSKYGVVIIYFYNIKLRDIIMAAISELQRGEANVAQLVERVHGKSL